MKAITIRMDGNAVVFTFDDGHIATFTPCMKGGAQKVVDLTSFELCTADKQQVFYYVGRQSERWLRDQDNQITFCRSGFDPKRAAQYWRAASLLVEYELHVRVEMESSHHIPVQLIHPDAIFKKGYDHLLQLEGMKCPECEGVQTA